jgi:FkbM family methyltransferase
LAATWKSAEFLTKDVYIGLPYLLPDTNPQRIFDVGANAGFATMFFSALYPEAQIVSIEPQMREVGYLRECVRLNGLAKVEVVNCAVGAEPGTMRFFTHDENSVVSSLSISRTTDGKEEEIKVMLLSTLLPDAPVDILKLDVEGAEREVLEDLSQQAALNPKRIRNIVMEYHRFDPEGISAFPDTLRLLEKSGYEYTLSARAHQSSAQQDVLVYCREKK